MTTRLEQLIKSPEGKTLEFKQDLSSLQNIMKTLTVFANSRGMRLRFTVYLKAAITTGVQSGVESGVESTMTIQLLHKIIETPLSKQELSVSFGKSKPWRYLNELVASMVKDGYLEYTIPDKPNSRLQKYKIAKKGRDLLGGTDETD